ncbi:MAG: hypothetical protein LQ342_002468 [Letrouitia transgressa]|nr:MAG: hypothetical protein LQ342_002468 [Letrouitia transgressa]
MHTLVHGVPPVTGTLCGKDVSFLYDVDGKNSTLAVSQHSREEQIYDRDVAGVIYDVRETRRNEVQPQLILKVAASQAPEATRMRFSFDALPVTNLPQSYLEAQLITKTPDHLYVLPNKDGSLNLHVIISVRSGLGEAQQFFDNVLGEALSILGLNKEDYVVHTTRSEKTITEISESILLPRANAGIAQTVLLLSGDGGIVDLVNVFLSSSHTNSFVKPKVGLLSLGTGNALANSSGLNRDTTRGLGSILRGASRSLPTFKTTFSPGSEYLVNEGRNAEPLATSAASGVGTVYGAVVCSWALHASLVADSDTTEYRKYGRQRFQMAAKELLAASDGSAPHVYQGKITMFKIDKDGKEYTEILKEKKHMYILASMVSNLEEKLTISPHSKPLDGQLRLLHLGKTSSAELMRILGMAFRGGGHVQEEVVNYQPVNGFRIDFDEAEARWRRVCVDGRIISVGRHGWMEVRRNDGDALDLVVDI